MKPAPNIIVLDIETSFDLIASYGLREQYHRPENIWMDWFMIGFCHKYLDGNRVYNFSLLDDPKRFKKNPQDDYAVVKRMHEVVSDADVLVGHNMAGFDWKKFYARVIYHKLPPIDKPKIVDTLKEARKVSFTSNKMSYLAKHLGLTHKARHSDDMWLRILRGEKKAVQECVDYCKTDVLVSEQMYLRLRPYMATHPNHNLWRADGIECCRNCNGDNIAKAGIRTTTTLKYQRYRCCDCGAHMQGTKSIKRVTLK